MNVVILWHDYREDGGSNEFVGVFADQNAADNYLIRAGNSPDDDFWYTTLEPVRT